MSNELAVLQGGPPAIAGQRQSALNAAAQANVQASFAIISYKGKTWKVKYRGEETPLIDSRGLPEPAFDVVVVGVASGISKQYYAKGFVEGDSAAPDCFSVNGVTPDPSSPAKQCNTCAVCPMNAWGSKVTDAGTKAKACQDSRRIAIVPDGDLENEMFGGPVMMRLPPTTLANFAKYASDLGKKGAGMEYVVTRMTFDTDVAYPKIKFQPVRWLSQPEALTIVGSGESEGVMGNPQIERMLNEAVDEVAHDPRQAQPAASGEVDPLAGGGPAAAFAQPTPATPTPTPAPAAQPVVEQQPVAQPVAAAPAAKAGFGGKAAAQPSPAPVASKKGFGAKPAQVAQVAEAVVPQTAAAATPAQTEAVSAPVNVVQAAPSDMESEIEKLLNM
jgi:hypothetical protein